MCVFSGGLSSNAQIVSMRSAGTPPPSPTTILSQNTNSLITHWAGVKQINCRGGREAAADITDLTQRKLQRATLLKKYSNNHKDGTHYLSGSVREDVCFYGFYNDVTGVLEH